MIFIQEMTGDEVKNLSVKDLAKRMDEIIFTRNTEIDELFTKREELGISQISRVSDLLYTKIFVERDEDQQKNILRIAFRFLVQLEFSTTSYILLNDIFERRLYWSSPNFAITNYMLYQYRIISDRIALESFFNLIHCLDTGKIIESDSKFKGFAKWIIKYETPFDYFAPHIKKAKEYSRKFRDKEIHDATQFMQRLLRMDKPDQITDDEILDLEDILINLWRPLIIICNKEKPEYLNIVDGSAEQAKKFINAYHNTNNLDYRIIVTELAEEIKQSN